MQRAKPEDLNTPAFWDVYYTQGRSVHEGRPCPDVCWLLEIISTGRVHALDIGCGSGAYFQYLHSSRIDGIDISPQAVAQAQAAYPAARVTQGDISVCLPYPDASFDLVYCGEVLEHAKDPQRLVDEIYRVLFPGGVCVLNTPFENKIPADAHIWYISRADLVNLFVAFRRACVYRFDNSPTKDWWEHFLVVATK